MSDVASKLKVSELDFDAIKTNLKNFLGDQNELADYNFDGSASFVDGGTDSDPSAGMSSATASESTQRDPS